jgi:Xaa-Pro aminopeptidase
VDLPGQIFLDLAETSSFTDASSLIDSIRLTKSEEEVNRIRTAAKISERAFQRLVPEIEVRMTERKIANLLGAHLLEEGADRPYYVLVRAAERYANRLFCALPINKKTSKGDRVKIEYSADYRHYVNEAKSLVLIGTQPKPSEREHYQLHIEAMKAGAAVAIPGATAADVCAAEKRIFEEAGLKVVEGRSFGHGTGMNCHEPPVVGPNDKTRLQPGMVFVLEPGGIPNAEGSYAEISTANTVIVKTSGPAERLPPLSKEIICI